jgi:S-adenosylmethionine:tRNA ribosyltransferase-isomerase
MNSCLLRSVNSTGGVAASPRPNPFEPVLPSWLDFAAVRGILRPKEGIVLNDTRVVPARLQARKPTGGAIELLLVRRLDPSYGGGADRVPEAAWQEDWHVLARGLAGLAPGAVLALDGGLGALLLARGERGECRVRFTGTTPGGVLAAAERIGRVPLPPYIEAARRRLAAGAPGAAISEDRERYQTVYARVAGAVAAPTAGLHFTKEVLDAMRAGGHELAWVTLHVGPGTFRPVEVEDPREHRVDAEPYDVPEETAAAVRRAGREGRPVVAVGTTVVRALETAAAQGEVHAGRGWTDLTVLPGMPFRVVTDLVTNFHLPRSSLLLLVAAFAGRDHVLAAYRQAIEHGYRFYSYGDAMFIRGGDARL